MDDDPLTPDDAAAVVGVPAYQLRTWAYDKVGPVNVGTRWRPMYRERDLREWARVRSGAHGEAGDADTAPARSNA